MHTPIILCAAGTDPSGGAGVAADARVCLSHDAHCAAVITAVVAQSTLGVSSFQPLAPSLVASQWDALLDDLSPDAVKLGMLAHPDIALALAPRLAALPPHTHVVFDPVLRSGHGAPLSSLSLLDALRTRILPHTSLLTPNVPEAEALLDRAISSTQDLCDAALALLDLGPRAVLLKGGHLPGAPGDALAIRGAPTRFLDNGPTSPRDVHGTGCHLSTALACALAAGLSTLHATQQARALLRLALDHGRWRPGRGREILSPFPRPERLVRDAPETSP